MTSSKQMRCWLGVLKGEHQKECEIWTTVAILERVAHDVGGGTKGQDTMQSEVKTILVTKTTFISSSR